MGWSIQQKVSERSFSREIARHVGPQEIYSHMERMKHCLTIGREQRPRMAGWRTSTSWLLNSCLLKKCGFFEDWN